ncbi:MAG: hypothetical protein L0H79_18220, partial [Intrasporangium sp.]|uniref:hypothetical protein n=1 Tax=Intrasporangium sp. TaxID=1925024 RepID=UPI00264A2A1D
ACTEYWQGVDFARANPAGTAYAGTSSAEAAGAADYRAGADQAHRDLASLTGPAPAAGGSDEGFTDYRAGVDAAKAGTAADATRSAHTGGWQDTTAGLLAGAALIPGQPARSDGGFISGFLHAHGSALAQGGQAAPTGGLQQSVASGGHAGYLAGMATARAALTSLTPPETANALGHGDFVAGVAHARASARGVAPAAGSAARSQACTEYWQGVDFARANPAGAAYAGTSSAEAAGAADYRTGLSHALAHPAGTALASNEPAALEGATDYWQGEAQAPTSAVAPGGPVVATTAAHTDYWNGAAHAQASLVNLQGASPAGRVEALGFGAYRSGAYGAHHAQPDVPAALAYTNAWHAYTDAAAHVRAAAVNPARTDSAYLYGVLHTNPPVPKRPGDDPGRAGKRVRHS